MMSLLLAGEGEMVLLLMGLHVLVMSSLDDFSKGLTAMAELMASQGGVLELRGHPGGSEQATRLLHIKRRHHPIALLV